MSNYEPSPLLPIGNKKFLSVEYPGVVRRTKRAIKTLGGEKALARSLALNSHVDLWYRPEDTFSHPIHGDVIPTSKLLVKVTRRIKRNKLTGEIETESKWDTEVVGNVTHAVRFRALADLQHLVPKNDPIRQLREAMDVGNVENMLNYEPTKEEDASGDLHNIPPPMFSARMTVTDYGYRQNLPVLRVKVKQPDGSYKIGLINRDRRAALELTQVKFDVENIPTQSWQLIKKAVDPIINKAIELVGELFEQRPIWTRYAIRCVLEPKYSKHLIKALANHAYTFTNGPWRDTWVKYGIDPRKNVEYHKYQILDARRFHDSESRTNKYTGIKSVMMYKRRDASNEPVNLTNKHIFDGHSTPGPSSMYQLCDITDPEITPMLYNENYLQKEANIHSGYYYQCVFDRIRRYVREKQVHLVKENKPLHIPDAEKGLMNEVEQEKQKKEYEKINQVTAEKAVAEAQAEMAKPGSSQRLKEVVDEYIEGLEESKSGDKSEYLIGDGDGDDDSDLDLIDTLEEYDEDFDVFNEDDENEIIEDEENQGVNMNIDE